MLEFNNLHLNFLLYRKNKTNKKKKNNNKNNFHLFDVKMIKTKTHLELSSTQQNIHRQYFQFNY